MPSDSQRLGQGLRLEHHTLAAAKGPVVHSAVPVVGEVAQIVQVHRHQPSAWARRTMPCSKKPAKNPGKMVMMSKRIG